MAATSVLDETTVIAAWLRTLDGIPDNKVNTVLPDVALWADTGFVQVVGAVGGSPWVDAAVQQPVIEIDTWGAQRNVEKPDWGKASGLMSTIRDAAQALGNGVTVTVGTRQARIISLWPISTPRKPLAGIDQGDASSFARLMIDIQMIWHPVPV